MEPKYDVLHRCYKQIRQTVLFAPANVKQLSYGINIFFRELAGPVTFCPIFIIKVACG